MGRPLIEIKSRTSAISGYGSRFRWGRNPGFDPRRSRTFNLAAPFRGGVVVCGSVEERRERGGWPYGDDAGVVDPHAVEELADQLAALAGVGFVLPEAAEVL
jgi:hypothetical protein